jgi:hypothetical protein
MCSYIICLTIAPVFFAASIYLILSRIIVHYGIHHARISPKAISITFMMCDFIALLLGSVGGAIADTASTQKLSNQGTHIMVGGLGFQALSLLLFVALAGEFALNVRRDRRVARVMNPRLALEKRAEGVNGRSERSFKRFLVGMSSPAFLIKANMVLTERDSSCSSYNIHPHSCMLPSCGAVEGIRRETRK